MLYLRAVLTLRGCRSLGSSEMEGIGTLAAASLEVAEVHLKRKEENI